MVESQVGMNADVIKTLRRIAAELDALALELATPERKWPNGAVVWVHHRREAPRQVTITMGYVAWDYDGAEWRYLTEPHVMCMDSDHYDPEDQSAGSYVPEDYIFATATEAEASSA